jgi:hypothetical protein
MGVCVCVCVCRVFLVESAIIPDNVVEPFKAERLIKTSLNEPFKN